MDFMNPAVTTFDSALGRMAIAWQGSTLLGLTFGHRTKASALASLDRGSPTRTPLSKEQKQVVERLQRFAEGEKDDFSDLSLDLAHLRRFSQRVVDACRTIPYGTTLSYAELARLAGSPRASRAVGNVMASNLFPLIVPCHRVVGSSGQLGGFSAPQGISMKRRLLAREQQG